MAHMKRHMSMNVEGALRWANLKNLFQDESGRRLSDKEAREYLKLCRFEGKRVIPIGECDNFCFQEGCRGHPEEE